MVANVSKAITTNTRMTEASLLDASTEHAGEGFTNRTIYALQVYVHVRWPWITFIRAILLLLLIYVFFALVVAQPRKHKTAVWKSSPPALLFHGVDKEEQPAVDEVPSMQSRAENLRIRLRKTASGVKLYNDQD